MTPEVFGHILRSRHGKKPFVMGDGNPKASVVILGFQPERDETKPFTGPNTKVMREVLHALRVHPHLVYLTLVVKEYLAVAQDKVVDQYVRSMWAELCEVCDPRAVVLLGTNPFNAVTGRAAKPSEIGDLRRRRWVLEPQPKLNFFVTHRPYEVTRSGGLWTDVGRQFHEDLIAVFEGDEHYFKPEVVKS